jgi:hypothetical protein
VTLEVGGFAEGVLWVEVGVLGSGVSGQRQGGVFGRGGQGLCRVAAFQVFAGYILADFFITISHCAWRHVISDMTFRVKRRCSDFYFTHIRVGAAIS